LNEIRALAQELEAQLPLSKLARDAYSDLNAAGLSEHDHASYFEWLELRAKT
jgi:3-hydroxyisobutyrate dehydrogenase-like beta-hydroxyacid dehydrogenase